MAKVAQGVPSGDLVAKLLLILIVLRSVRTLEHLTSSAQDKFLSLTSYIVCMSCVSWNSPYIVCFFVRLHWYCSFQSHCSDTGMSENLQNVGLQNREPQCKELTNIMFAQTLCSMYTRQWWPLPFAGHSKPPGPTGLSPATTMATAWANAHWPHPHRWLPSVIWSLRAFYTFVVLSFQKHVQIWQPALIWFRERHKCAICDNSDIVLFVFVNVRQE